MYWVGLILSSFNIPKYNTEKPSLGRKTEHPTVTATCHLPPATANRSCQLLLQTVNCKSILPFGSQFFEQLFLF